MIGNPISKKTTIKNRLLVMSPPYGASSNFSTHSVKLINNQNKENQISTNKIIGDLLVYENDILKSSLFNYSIIQFLREYIKTIGLR